MFFKNYLIKKYLSSQQMILNSNGHQQYYQNGSSQSPSATTPVIMYQVPQQQSQQLIQIPPPPQQQTQPPPQQLGPRQVQHKEAYIKYISNLRKQQHLNSLPVTLSSQMPSGDWHSSLDVRLSRIKESRVMPPPVAWIENCDNQNDVLKHLVSLRCYMLQDAVSIQKNIDENNKIDNENSLVEINDSETVLMEL